MAWQPRETLRRTIVNTNGEWLGLHRGLGGEHRAPGWRRRRNPWLAYVGPGGAALITAAAIMLLLSGYGHPHGKIPPQALPGIVATVLPSSGPAVSASSYPARASTQSPADRTTGSTPAPTEAVPEMAGAPVPAPTPTPAATTAAADAPPPLPPPVPPVVTSTPPVCPPLPTPGKSKKAKPSHPSHW